MSGGLVGSERLIVVVGPSGAGKDSVIAAWLANLPEPHRPYRVRRTITRAPDPHEDHEPIDAAGFEVAAAQGAFVFHWQAHGLRYGIRREQLAALQRGGWVVMNGSRQHLPRLLQVAPRAQVIEIDAPLPLRLQRLGARGREPDGDRQARLTREPPSPRAVLRVDNDGPLAKAVVVLVAWWGVVSRQPELVAGR